MISKILFRFLHIEMLFPADGQVKNKDFELFFNFFLPIIVQIDVNHFVGEIFQTFKFSSSSSMM